MCRFAKSQKYPYFPVVLWLWFDGAEAEIIVQNLNKAIPFKFSSSFPMHSG